MIISVVARSPSLSDIPQIGFGPSPILLPCGSFAKVESSSLAKDGALFICPAVPSLKNADCWRFRIECGSSARPQRLRRALGAGQIVDDRGGVLRRYRRPVDVDHLIHDLLPNVPRQRGLIQRVIGRMTGEAVTVHRIRSRAVRKRRVARWELQIGRYQLVELLSVTG